MRPAISSFPNLTGRHLHRAGRDAVVPHAQAHRVEVNPGARVALGTLTIEVGGTTEVDDGHERSAAGAGGERRAVVHRRHRIRVQSAAGESQLRCAAGTGAGREQHARRPDAGDPARRRRRRQFHARRRDGHGSRRQPAGLARQRRSDCRSARRRRRATRPSTAARAVCRSTPSPRAARNQFRGSLYDVERNSKWNANSRTNILNGDPKPFQDERDWGFALGGPVGRPGGKNKLFFYFNLEMNPRNVRQHGQPLPHADRARTRRVTSRSRPTTSATCIPTSRIRCCPAPAVPRRRLAASRTAACSAAFRRDRLYQPGLNILKWWPEPNIANVPAGQAYNYEGPTRRSACSATSRSSASTISRSRTCAATSSISSTSSRTTSSREPPGFNDTQEDDYGIWVPAGDRQLDDQCDDVRRSVVGRELPPSGRVLGRSADRRTSAATACR